MKNFELKRKFDVITCIFTSMNYNKNYKELEKTLRNFYNHLKGGGIVVFDITPEKLFEKKTGQISMKIINDRIKLVRLTQILKEGDLIKSRMVFIWKNGKRVEMEIDEHFHGSFNVRNVEKVLRKVGFGNIRIFSGFEFKRYSGREDTIAVIVARKS